LWGAAFKPGTDDVRDSPALDVADRLSRLGAQVVVYDPQAAGNALVEFPHLDQVNSPLAAAAGADAVLVGAAWPEFAAVDPAAVAAVAGNRLVIDACQGISAGQWRAEGWTVAAPFPTSNHDVERSRLTQHAARDSRAA
jgi:UDPglucose 6-dehydrogenase